MRRSTPADCAECETKEGKIDRIDRVITFEGDLTAEQRARLLEIADKCPVHRTLKSEVDIRTVEATFKLTGGFLHAFAGFGDHFRNGRVVARRHDVDAGDAGDGGKLVDQLHANARSLTNRVRGFFHARDERIRE